jgi:hypothetical protein
MFYMRIRSFFSVLLLLIWITIPGIAQKAQTKPEVIHYIKLGNTLRAVDKPQQAIELLQRALGLIQGNDPYWEAVAYENMGMAYADQQSNAEAVRSYQKALEIYRKLNFAASVTAMQELIDLVTGKALYAGIDIGSSGVKLAIFRTTFENGFYNKDIRSKPLSPNVSLVSGTDQSFDDAQTVMKAYIDSIRHYNILNKHVYIAFSSGVNETLGKTPEKKAQLYKLLTKLVANDSLKIDTTLTAAREAELYVVGAIPRKMWQTTACIDIGSGNTKGGYFDEKQVFHPITIPYGTKTLTNQIDNQRSLDLESYKQEGQRVMNDITEGIMKTAFANEPGIQQRRTVGVGGGAAWAMVTYLHPEKAGTTAVPITRADIERFKQLAMSNYKLLINPDLTAITDPEVRRKAEADILNAQYQFNEKQIIAGALLLEGISNVYANGNLTKRFVFIRDSDIGWVTGKFLEMANQEYDKTIAKEMQNP